VIAGAGFGKTTLLAKLAETRPAAWYTVDETDGDPGALAAGIAGAIRAVVPEFRSDLEELARGPAPVAEVESLERAAGAAHRLVDEIEASLSADLVLVLDDAHLLSESAPAWYLVETLVRVAPQHLHVVIGSRTEPPFSVERMRGQGQVLDLGGPELAFDPDEIERVLATVLGTDVPDAEQLAGMADRIHELTAGWPAAVRLAAEALRAAGAGGRAAALGRLDAPGGPLFTYLAEEVVAQASLPVRELVRHMSYFDRLSVALCDALGLADAERTVTGLARRALFLQPISGEAGWFELHGLVRDYVMAHLPLPSAELTDMHARAATWFMETNQPEAALRSLVRAGDTDRLAAFLRSRGADLVARGMGRDVAVAIDALPVTARDEPLELLLGEASIAVGDWTAAIGALQRAAGNGERLSAAIAWRLGVLHGLRGAYVEALAIYRRADLAGAAPEDEAFLFAYMASALRHHGDATATSEAADRALAAAIRSGRPRALAAAQAAVGQAREMANETAAAIEAYERALVAAQEAGDAVQRVRILTAIGSESIDMGRFAAALSALDQAVELSRAIGFAAFQARALAERGRARWWVGQMDEGLADMAAGRELYARLDAPGRVFALLDEGELHLYRGDLILARTRLEDAVRAARESSDVLLGLCLAELAETCSRDDPARAGELIVEAVELGRRLRSAPTLGAASYTYLVMGDTARANELALEVEAIALRSGELPQVALAREVQGRVAGDPATARRLFESALEIWHEVGAPFGIALNRLEYARTVADPEARVAAAEAQRSLQAFGARAWAAEATAILTELDQAERPEVSIRTLGGFGVMRSGRPVPASEWRSKKARDLLKILAARRGRPVPREQLFELLWPDEDPEPLGNRLSVALATVRSILDPERQHDSDRFIGADRTAVWLKLEQVDLDVEAFLTDVAAGRRLLRAGHDAEALEPFERAEAAYRGEFLEEDPYEDFAVGLREEAQAAYVDAAREVARHASAAGDPDTAIRIQLRILELDAFDERAHVGLIRALIAAGRHGEARRRYGVFAARMAEIGVEAAPFPAPDSGSGPLASAGASAR
jgi:ATP/maltotriose-dependent transcriptional regulator MalT/two-component SAPR family response regulator